MAKYIIRRIDQMTANQGRGMLNAVVKVEGVDGERRMFFEFETNSPGHDFNSPASFTLDNSDLTYPTYDILDICIKSSRSRSYNPNVPGNVISENAKTHCNDDAYFALSSNPIQICQHNGNAYLLTQPLTKTPYMLKTDAISNIEQNKDNMSSQHKFHLEQEDIQTYFYANSSQQKSNGDNIENDFEAYRKVSGVKYNFVLAIDQSLNPVMANQINDNTTIYFNGDIYGQFFAAKNMYNSLYSMQMANANRMQCCRLYIGMQSMANGLALKFYDNTDYVISANADGELTATASDHSEYIPYQKVETFIPNKMNVNAMHKSNLFSIKLQDTGLDDVSINQTKLQNPSLEATRKKLAERIKKDIANGIQALVDSIAPANTQLFKTYYIS